MKNKLIFMLMGIFLLMFLVGNVSSFDFDNVKSYDSVKKEITITNNFGLGSDLAVYKLTENTDQCLINCYAEGQATLYSEGYLFTDMKFKNTKNQEVTLPHGEIYIEEFVNYEYQEEDGFKEVCEDVLSNLTKSIEKVCHEEQIYKNAIGKRKEYVLYQGQLLTPGTYKWRIEGTKEIEDSIDWVGSSFGKEFTEWAWWSSSWDKKRKITLTDLGNNNINNYTADFVIPYDSDMNADFSDIRFTNNAENAEYGYWFYFANSTEARVHVRIEDNLTAGGNTTFYMYYGNSGASTTQDIEKAHLVGEDGSDFSEWTETDDGKISLNTTNKRLEFNALPRTGIHRVYLNLGYELINFTMSTTIYKTAQVNGGHLSGGGISDNVDDYSQAASSAFWIFDQSGADTQFIRTFFNTAQADTGSTSATELNTFKRYEINRFGTNVNFTIYSSNSETATLGSQLKTNYGSATEPVDTAFMIIGFDQGNPAATVTGWVTNYTLSKYIYPEPIITIGNEELQGSLSVDLNSPADSYISSNNNITFNCSATDDVGVTSVKLIINNIVNYTLTNSSANQNLSVYHEITNIPDGVYTWACNATDGVEAEKATGTRSFTINTTPGIVFTDPTFPDYANISIGYVPMAVNVSTNYFNNITYSLRNVNGTNLTQFFTNQTYNINFTDIATAHYHYDVTICTTTGQCNMTETRHINHDISPPIINFTQLGNIPYHAIGNNLTINWTIIEDSIDSCIFSYAGVNKSVTCSNNGTTINVTSYSNKNVTLWVNDSFGNSNSSTLSWDYVIFENSREYSPTIAETFIDDYILKLTLGSGVSLTSGNLIYNGTSYTTSITYSGNNRTLSKSLSPPDITGATNISFYWSLITSEGVINTSSSTQAIQNLSIDNCAINTHVILNYTIYDEDSRAFLNSSLWNTTANIYVKLSGEFSGETYEYYSGTITSNGFKVCVNNALISGEDYRLDSIVQYKADDYVTEYHYIENYTLNTLNSPQQIALYLLTIARSQEFLITFKNSNFIPQPGAIIELTREYLELGQFLSVEVTRTDSDGRTIGHFVLNDEVYTIYVKLNGELIATFENVRAFCDDITTGNCRINLNQLTTSSNPSSFKNYLGIIATDTYDDETKTYQLDFTTIDSSTKTINVTLYKYDLMLNTIICSQEISSSAGSLQCIIPEAYYNNTALVKILVDGEEYGSYTFDISGGLSSRLNPTRYFLAFILVITLPFLAFTSGPMTLVLFIIGLILAGGLMLLDWGGFIGPFSAFLWFVIAAIILLIKASSRRQQ